MFLPNNKFNSIIYNPERNLVLKKGKSEFLRGECYFYKNIPKHLQDYFPKFLEAADDYSSFSMEYIDGVSVYTLLEAEKLEETHLLKIFYFMDKLHSSAQHSSSQLVSHEDVECNYIKKLENRFCHVDEYPFADRQQYQKWCMDRLQGYLQNRENVKIVPFIHGDLWFSNMMFDTTDHLKVFDMKGQVNHVLTTSGDVLYDYGKLYQSILGYDLAIYDNEIPTEYQNKIRSSFLLEIEKRKINLFHLKIITFSLVIGTFYFIKEEKTKQRVWAWMKLQIEKGFM